MKKYDVYTPWGVVAVEAEDVTMFSINDRPIKIRFTIGDTAVAEFYCEHVSGWVERKDATNERN